MTQEKHFYIEGSNGERPHSSCSIYVDGTAGEAFRESIDVELSHWVPNRTEDCYKAGTSTEMPFNDPDGYESDPQDTDMGKVL